MPFRSAKHCSRPLSESVRQLFWLMTLLFAVLPAYATVTVTPISNLAASSSGVALSNVSGNAIYYPNSSGLVQTAQLYLDTSDTSVPALVDLTKTQAEASPYPNMLMFSVYSSKPLSAITGPSGSQLAVSVSTGSNRVAIAYAQPAAGGGGLCNTMGVPTCQGHSGSYWLAAPYTAGTVMQIGIYPADICGAYFASPGGSAGGCSGASVVGTSGSPIQLTFNIDIAQDNTNVPTGSPGSFDTSSAYNITFVNTGSTMSCASSPLSVFFPGDTQILFSPSGVPYTQTTGAAPVTTVIALANKAAATTDQTVSYKTANTLYSRMSASGSSQAFSGFTNTADGVDSNYYALGYMVRDAAGLVATAAGTPPSPCDITNVRTASIQGFLSRSNCFIATAAFRSVEATPVRMLRQFRDSVLLKSAPGEMFVRWYYHWSPNAAEWLMRHPLFRFPILLALIPFEVVAWLFLHPEWMALFSLLNGLVLLRVLKGTAHEA